MSSEAHAAPWALVWDDSLSVGNAKIDREHQTFIGLVNELNEAVIGRLSRQEIAARLQALVLDAKQHFAHEEALFEQWRYPKALEHAQQHRKILDALDATLQRFQHDCTEYELIESGLDIKAALIEHLLSHDMLYRDYLVPMNREPDAPGSESSA